MSSSVTPAVRTDAAPEPDPSRFDSLDALTLMGAFRRLYIRQLWRVLGLQGEPVALFGAGRHTRWLLQATWDVPGPPVVCVLDDAPPVAELCGQPVRRPETGKPPCRRILVSSDAHEALLADRCRELFGEATQVLRLYEGLPPGPYLR